MSEFSGERLAERDKRFARDDIAAIQASDARIDEKKLDNLLGIVGDFKRDEEFVGPAAAARFPKERWGYQGTQYETIRSIIRATKPHKGQIFYDLGSGQGRVVLYGALASDAKFVGIELLQERVDACNKTKAKLGIENAEFRAGNVTDFDISDGDIFYLFNPFVPATAKKVITTLQQIAGKKKIEVVCMGGIQLQLMQERWLSKRPRIYGPDAIDIFDSKEPLAGQ